jgi:glycosyltransferase involved in cell wall biosynthesis
MLTAEQVARAARACAARAPRQRVRVVSTGRLSVQKNEYELLRSPAALRGAGVELECAVVGEGPERTRLEALAGALGVADRVRFTGAVPFDEVLGHYEWADVLVLPSETEGWPKTIAEGMAFGLACIGPDRGIVPEMLGEGRGLVVPPRDVDALTAALGRVLRSPDERSAMQRRGALWAQQFTLERFGAAVRDVLARAWDADGGARAARVAHA